MSVFEPVEPEDKVDFDDPVRGQKCSEEAQHVFNGRIGLGHKQYAEEYDERGHDGQQAPADEAVPAQLEGAAELARPVYEQDNAQQEGG